MDLQGRLDLVPLIFARLFDNLLILLLLIFWRARDLLNLLLREELGREKHPDGFLFNGPLDLLNLHACLIVN